MKKFVIFAVFALFLATVAAAEAKPRGGDDPPPPPDGRDFGDTPTNAVKWSQMPEMDEAWGYDVESNHDLNNQNPNVVVMDDFQCWNGNPITDVHWWGSYFDPYEPFNNPIIGFHVSFHTDIAAVGVPGETGYIPSHPGDLLEAWDIDIAACNEVFYGVDHDGNGNAVYQYYVDLPDPFYQEEGIIYWLDIKAILFQDEGVDAAVWGWHTAERRPEPPYHWGDDAVQVWDYDQDTGEYGEWISLEWEGVSLDMAFELTAVPEPMTLMMIGGALAGLAAFARRKK